MNYKLIAVIALFISIITFVLLIMLIDASDKRFNKLEDMTPSTWVPGEKQA